MTSAMARMPRPCRHGAGFAARIVAGLAAVLPQAAAAFGFELNEDWRGAWNTAIVAAAAWRAQAPDPQFVGFGNRNQFPGAFGQQNSADDSNLNFGKGNIVTAPVSIASELELRYRDRFGAFGRVRAWDDLWLGHHGVPHGHVANGYVPGARLDDSGFYNSNRFRGVKLQDLFAWGNFDLGEARLTARVGKQVINWGESLLFPGFNAFNPLNLSAAGRPGSRIEDALTPLNRVYLNLLPVQGPSLEAFYDLAWTRSSLPACGTFASPSDLGFDPSCNLYTPALGLPDRTVLERGLVVQRSNAPDPGRGGQWGLATRWFAEPLGTEFGLFYVRYHSANPMLNAIKGTTELNSAIEVQYPQDVQAFALSAATGMRNLALSAELSFTRGLPAQRNFVTVVQGLSGGGPYAAGVAATPVGGTFPGYLRVNRTQLLAGGTLDLGSVVGVSDASITAEGNFQWVTNLPGTDRERIGRNPNYGTAAYDGQCQGGLNVCEVAGFATPFSWGYRVLARMTVPNVASGVALQPVAVFSQDVRGYSTNGELLQGRWAAGLVLRVVYQRAMFIDFGRTWFRRDTPFDPLRDRAVYTVLGGVTF